MATDWDDLIARHLGHATLDHTLRDALREMLQEAAGATSPMPPAAPAAGRPAPARGGLTFVPDTDGDVTEPDVLPQLRPSPTWDPTGDQRAEPATRYRRLGVLGTGGMGAVWKVEDSVLRRFVAMKVVGERVLTRPKWMARFFEEAQATAQLEHPGIVPVYDLGRLPDGRPYYTMRQIHGRGLDTFIAELHAASPPFAWSPTPSGWTFRRLVEALSRATEAVAYAHARGVIHRDLKPANIMLGSFGEVQVVDWGLAKVVGVDEPTEERAVSTNRSERSELSTAFGETAGTLLYMSPEQQQGLTDELGPGTDVFALGICLAELLLGQAPPLRERNAAQLRAQLTALPGSRRIPAELVDVVVRAAAPFPDDRFADAAELATAIRAWLDGARRREQALALLHKAAAHRPRMVQARRDAALQALEAERMLDEIPREAPVPQKRTAWALQDRAEALSLEAASAELAFVQGVQAALSLVPDLPEAHARLAEHYRAEHESAEARGDAAGARRCEALLRTHDDGTHAAWLEGTGALSLVAEPPAQVRLFCYQAQDRRLVPVFQQDLGPTPLVQVPLPMGRYLVELSAPGHSVARYPVHITRGRHWHGRLPGSEETTRLPLLRDLPESDAYVPAGWFFCGGDPHASQALPARQVWVDGFVIQRFNVTNQEYLDFLDDLVAQGREAEALELVPREKPGRLGTQGEMIFGRNPDGTFFLTADGDGDVWRPDWPVMMLPWHACGAYAEWWSARTGHAWRLPCELEWEKAARGVDGRVYPWGDFFDPTWANTRDRDPSSPLMHPVGACPVDESPYGVRDMAGGVRDWCADAYIVDGPLLENGRLLPVGLGDPTAMRADRGGSWSESSRGCRVTARDCTGPLSRAPVRGFRLVRSV